MLYSVALMGDLLMKIKVMFPMNTGTYKMLFNNKIVVEESFVKDTGFKSTDNFLQQIPSIFAQEL